MMYLRYLPGLVATCCQHFRQEHASLHVRNKAGVSAPGLPGLVVLEVWVLRYSLLVNG